MHGYMPNIRMGHLKEKNKNKRKAINEGNKTYQTLMKSRGDGHKKSHYYAWKKMFFH
jgi:hypothetical protein